MAKLRDATLSSDYAWQQLDHLCNNIGPRLSGSPQANFAVQYVAEELRKLGADVKVEKVMVPHWVRGEERAELVSWPGMTPSTMQKIILTALGGSVATPADGITADVIEVTSYDELAKLGRDKIKGKIVFYPQVAEANLRDVVSHLLAQMKVADFGVEDPPLEDVLRASPKAGPTP